MREVWRPVEVCEAYEVSSLGRIRRVLPGNRTKVGNIVKSEARTRYRTATLVFNGVRHYVHIHTLVCETFHGKKPTPKHQVAHLNGDSHDNRADNLCWATAVENCSHRVLHGTAVKGENVFGAKLTERDVLDIRTRHSSGETYTSLGRKYGVYYTTISKIIERKTWKHVAD